MRCHIKIFCLLLNAVVLISCKPADSPRLRNKRQYGFPAGFGDDSYLMKELWDEPVGLGFFVSPSKGGEPADSDTTRTLRDKVAQTENEGSGEIRRDEIASEPTEPIFFSEKKKESNAQQAELTGEVKAKIEKTETKMNDEDPGDKKKIRSSVTCQGQKEWIQCDGPYELIKIKEAFWGRDDEATCTKSDISHGLKTDKNCVQDADNTLRKVREACNSENVCEVVASDIYFDKTDCPDIYKYLKLKWQCAPSESRIKEPVS